MSLHRKTLTVLMTGAAACTLLLAPAIVAPSFAPAMAQARVSNSVDFRTALEPYGAWQTNKRWGAVWVPAHVTRDWRPYTVGHWVYSDDYGWYWVSDNAEADWGWVTYHYGRWATDADLGWVWIPGDEWAPAWVDWRQGDDYVGWAPLPPDELIVAYDDDPAYWSFVRPRDLVAVRLAGAFLPLARRGEFLRQTVVVNRTVAMRDRHVAVNPGIAPARIAAAAGRPIRTYDVRPRILAGTAGIPGAIQVRAADLRRHDRTARETVTARRNGEIQPGRNLAPVQALGRNQNGRLGDHPPRAAQGGVPATTGAAPSSPSAARRPSPSTTTGQAPSDSKLDTGRRGPNAERRERGVPPSSPSARGPVQHPSTTTGAAPPSRRELNAGAEQRRGPAGPQNRVTPQANSHERATPPVAARPQAPQARQAPAPMARPAPPQAARAPAPPPQAPVARAPAPPPQAPVARAPAPPAPTAQAPRAAPSTTGAAPRGGPHEERK